MEQRRKQTKQVTYSHEHVIKVVGEFLKELRLKRDINIEILAKRIKRSVSYMEKIENGTRGVGMIEFLDLVEALEVKPEDPVREVLARLG